MFYRSGPRCPSLSAYSAESIEDEDSDEDRLVIDVDVTVDGDEEDVDDDNVHSKNHSEGGKNLNVSVELPFGPNNIDSHVSREVFLNNGTRVLYEMEAGCIQVISKDSSVPLFSLSFGNFSSYLYLDFWLGIIISGKILAFEVDKP